MKKNIKTFCNYKKGLTFLFVFLCVSSFAQNVVINEQGVTTSTHASTTILDLSGSHLGFLMPNMTTAQMQAISSPKTSLLVFNTEIGCFEFYDGTTAGWLPMWCLCNAAPAPAPTISGSTTPCSGSSQVYTISNVAAINAINYEWSVPTGCTITAGQGTPTITVTIGSTSGTISVQAANSCGTAAAGTLAITISAGNVTAAPTSNSPVCTGNTLDLFAGGSGGSVWAWTGPNAFTSTSENPTITNVTAAAAGTYSVVASSGGSCGSSGTQTVTVVINTTPTITVTPTSSTICDGSSTTITASGASSYSWYPSTNLSPTAGTAATETATPPSTITYSVTGTSAAGCPGSNTATCAITVNPLPTVTGLGPTTTPSCISKNGENITYTVNSVAGETYTWSATTGTIVSGQGTATAAVSWTASGTETVSVYATITATGCVGPAVTYTVNVSPSCNLTYTGCGASGSFTVPAGITTLTLSVSGAEGGPAYQGSFGELTEDDGSATYGANITATYASTPGTTLDYYIGCMGGAATYTAGGAGGDGGGAGGTDEAGGAGYYWGGVSTCTGTSQVSAAQTISGGGGGGGGSCIRLSTATGWGNDIIAAGGGGGGFSRFVWLCQDCQNHSGSGNCNDVGGVGGYLQINYYVTGFMLGTATGCGGTTSTPSAGGTDYLALGTEGGGGASTTTAGTGAPASGLESLDLTNCVNTAGSCGGSAGHSGSSGVGGAAGYQGFYAECSGTCERSAGGGGGGGHYGGGGGAGGGGGGGSSYINASCTLISNTSCSQSGNGQISITW
ncbi:MAG: hypothetical protein ACLQQ4_13115 [Bacteroidia bacterium]